MKKISKLWRWAAVCVSAFGILPSALAQTPVYFYTRDFTGSAVNNPITLTSLIQIQAGQGSFLVGLPITLQPMGGYVTNSLFPGIYNGTIQGIEQPFCLLIPNTNVLANATNYILSGVSRFQATNLNAVIEYATNYFVTSNLFVSTNGVANAGGVATNLVILNTDGTTNAYFDSAHNVTGIGNLNAGVSQFSNNVYVTGGIVGGSVYATNFAGGGANLTNQVTITPGMGTNLIELLVTNTITGSAFWVTTNGNFHATNAANGAVFEGTNGGFYYSGIGTVSNNLSVLGGQFQGNGAGLTNYAAINLAPGSGPIPSGVLTAGTTNGAGHLLVVNGNGNQYITYDGGAVTNLNGTNIQSGTINSNALDTLTKAQLAHPGDIVSLNGYGSNLTLTAPIILTSTNGSIPVFAELYAGGNLSGAFTLNVGSTVFPNQTTNDDVGCIGWNSHIRGGASIYGQRSVGHQYEALLRAVSRRAGTRWRSWDGYTPLTGPVAGAPIRPIFWTGRDDGLTTVLFGGDSFTFNNGAIGTNGASFTIASNLVTVSGLLKIQTQTEANDFGGILINGGTNDAFINLNTAVGADRFHLGVAATNGNVFATSKAGDTVMQTGGQQTLRIITGGNECVDFSLTNVNVQQPLVC